MKNFKNIAVLSAAFLGLSLTSCNNDKYHYDPNYNAEWLKAAYNKAFTERYLAQDEEIPANQTWGFEDVTPCEIKTTRTSNPNSNEWANNLVIPAEITEAEAQYVYDHFNNLDANAGSVSINFTDFFVQHVWKGTSHYTSAAGHDVLGSNHMDHLILGKDHSHVNNFNTAMGSIMYLYGDDTTEFGYQNSIDSKEHYEYIAQEINVPGVGVGYYVAFDFSANGAETNQQVAADGKYTDWIIKVVPGEYLNAKRVMCEDLGSTEDFDFNDVVFDVAYTREYWPTDGTFAIITLRSAGGTMPLYVDGKEVHKAFGVPTSTMVNTGVGETCAPIQWRKKVESTNPNDISISVVNDTKSDDAIEYNLSAVKGKIPYKIAIPATADWAAEKQSIEVKYPKFSQWITNPSIEFWK